MGNEWWPDEVGAPPPEDEFNDRGDPLTARALDWQSAWYRYVERAEDAYFDAEEVSSDD